MKKLIIALMILIGCGSEKKGDDRPKFDDDHIPRKPFYVAGVQSVDVLVNNYTLIDADGYRFWISDSKDKYSIGDSIK